MAEYCGKQPNVARKIALDLSLNDVQALCKSQKACQKVVCQNNGFWKSKYKRDNPEEDSEPMDDDWKRHYQRALKSLFVIKGDDVDIPIELPITRGVASISCGETHMGLITTLGNLYTKGSNDMGRLGLPRNIRKVEEFTFIRDNVKKIKCASGTFYIDNNSDAYVAGLWNDDYGFSKIASNVFDIDASRINRIKYILIIDNQMDLYAGQYSVFNKNTINFKYVASDCGKITWEYYIIDIRNNLYIIGQIGEDLQLRKSTFEINTNIRGKGWLYTLTTDGKLYIKTLAYIGRVPRFGPEQLIDIDVVDVYETNSYRSLIYTKRNGDVYGRGEILWHLNIYIDEIFQDFINSFSNEHWINLYQDLNNESFPLVYELANQIYQIQGLDNIENLDDLYDKIFELTDRDKFGLLINLLFYPTFLGDDRELLYREIIGEYSKYSVLISTQVQSAQIYRGEVYVLSNEANFNVPREFL